MASYSKQTRICPVVERD